VIAFRGIGSYVPVDSPVHRLDAAAKIGVLAAFSTGLFLVASFWGLAVFGALIFAALALSRVPLGTAARGLRAITLILTLTVALNALAWNPAEVALVRLGPVAIMGPGLARGIFFAVRIVVLVIGTTLLTLTTSPIQISGGLERVLAPLRLVRVPVAELAMTLMIALRFIPTTAEEAERIVTAQSARGARFDEGGLITRAKAWIPVLVPLFFNLFKRADDLATAMEARCYRSAEERTRLHQERMGAIDWLVFVSVGTLALSLGVVL
jgi:energy-coupling factor transport system permease protein